MKSSEFPSVSVIVVNYNGAETLGGCLSSIRHLSYPKDKIETILVDNASVDRSLTLVKEAFSEVKVMSLAENVGFGHANNIGVHSAKGEFLAFVNPDARLDPEWLKAQMCRMDLQKGIVCTAAKILSWDGKTVDFAGGTIQWNGHGVQKGFRETVDHYHTMEPSLFGCGAAFVIDRSVFLEVGGFDESYFLFLEDVDLGWRLWLWGYQVIFVPDAVTFHKPHQSTALLTEEEKHFLRERNALWTMLKNYEEALLKFLLPRALLSLSQRWCEVDGGPMTDENMLALDKVNFFLRRQSPINKLSFHWYKKGVRAAFVHLADGLRRRGFSRLRVGKKIWLFHWVLRFVVEGLERTFEKREKIQKNRKRSDKEIFNLVGAQMPEEFWRYAESPKIVEKTSTSFDPMAKIGQE